MLQEFLLLALFLFTALAFQTLFFGLLLGHFLGERTFDVGELWKGNTGLLQRVFGIFNFLLCKF